MDKGAPASPGVSGSPAGVNLPRCVGSLPRITEGVSLAGTGRAHLSRRPDVGGGHPPDGNNTVAIVLRYHLEYQTNTNEGASRRDTPCSPAHHRIDSDRS